MYLLKNFSTKVLCLPQDFEHKIVIIYIEINFDNI